MPATDERPIACGESRGRLSGGLRIGPYQIADFIGAGGMGEVYRAHDTNLNRVVALKLLPVELAADPERLSRFEQEARAVSSVSHPAIVTIYDAGQIGSQPYISMELVAGATLRRFSSQARSRCAAPCGSPASCRKDSPKRMKPGSSTGI